MIVSSYPRCGNSFLRSEIEKKTKLVTGSDTRPNRTLSASLILSGFKVKSFISPFKSFPLIVLKGEGIVDDSVWVVKTHFPERMGHVRFPAENVIILVRNPFDAIESHFHMCMTNSHEKTLSEQVFSSK